jgi:tyrosyl-tRNA synthetase
MDRDEQIEALLTKGVEQVLPGREFLKAKLDKGEILTVYCGYDPSAPTLHIGHAITLRKLRQFQELGNRVIFLIGDFTARIGDPDKLAARKPLTEREVKANLKQYKAQASKFIRFSGKNAAMIKFNNKWLGKMKFADVIKLSSMMTVDQMLKRDMFVRRIEEGRPVYVHEFLYPLMQGYDSVAMDVDGEVGGNDQLFNMMVGRDLLKEMKQKEKFVITMKLLADNTGKKMGKSEGNMVAIADEPNDVYGKIMSWSDSLIAVGFELCTDYTMVQVAEVKKELDSGANPRDVKMKLAFEIVKSMHDEKSALKAQETFVRTFQEGNIADSDLPAYEPGSDTLEAFLIKQKLVPSKSELKRLADAGAIENMTTGAKLSFKDVKQPVSESGTYRVGKTHYFKLNV